MREWTVPPHIAGMTQIESYREIDEILRSKDFRQGSHTESLPLFAESLLLLDGPDHRERRRLENPLFDRAALLYYDHEALNPVVEQMVRECFDGSERVTVDLVVLVRAMLHRIAAAVTGIDGVDTPERTERFRWFVEQLGAAATVEWSTDDHDTVLARGLAQRDAFVEEFFGASVRRRQDVVAAYRAGELAREELPVDLLTLLYLHWDPEWDEQLPLREATLFLVAATQTTTHTLPHVLIHFDEWTRDHPEDAGREHDPEFLRLMVNESLRLHQPAPTLLRYATHAVTLASGRRIAEGERVALLFTPANRDPEVFGPDAQTFNPHRGKAAGAGVRPWGLTFGGGAHVCVGRPLVTGLAKRDGEAPTEGTMMRILRALYAAGVQLDPANPPVPTESSSHDTFSSMPVVLTRRPA
ncbi:MULTISPECIES: cytochrome P450 [unclassified Pseudonocardia]|jgi:cytochrome P450|uniref:cytochrome P450 n=1 Tax=unclassified Pseudonocardia TaxID=2619320 RepID=UPI000A5722B2|nr:MULTISPECIES: cytochrome P450 [unclassified Pseudonocardia]MBN9098646.1 cytochrome P450 [Pseudonocardia sp.]